MSLTLSDHRRKRSAAKGNITKLAGLIQNLQAVKVSKLDISQLKKYKESLERYDDAFQSHHQAIGDDDEESEDDQHMAELSEHENTLRTLHTMLTDFEDRHNAFRALRELQGALEALELDSEEGYSASLDADLEEARELSQKLRTARAEGSVSEWTELTTSRDVAVKRLKALQRARDAAVVPKSSEAAEDTTSKPIQITKQGLALELPTFDGTMMKWHDFWGLFSSLIEQETHLSDDEKRCHLVTSMGSAEARANAEDATAFASNYQEAVERLKKIYEQNRILHSHHLADFLQPIKFQDTKADVRKFLKRI